MRPSHLSVVFLETRAARLESLLKAADPSIAVAVNPEKPRKGCFEVRANSSAVLSLTDMPRPFAKLKALDMEQVASDVVKALK
ncbi:hypothetical protein AB1Y20_007623 [Prymnesium parvum]|uniref:Selenoprotein F/M domain-containing protein n=1 Tax=Prymnesium parvum TaxID=97485 RepID=A0AB34IY31_PRYPA